MELETECLDRIRNGRCVLLQSIPKENIRHAVHEACINGPEESREQAVALAEALGIQNVEGETITPLSRREMQILRMLAEGHTYRTCATALSVALDTVRFHVRHIYTKLHVHSKTAAVTKAYREGILG
jgi:DNA-binding NarL/FixJ family response regulator